MNVYGVLAGAVVLLHVLFVVFAVGGGLLALRWPRVAWIHVPAVAWAAFIEFSGGVCPLTPLENALRRRGGLEDYSGDFIAAYVFPLLYPDGLTRRAQLVLGSVLLSVNLFAYCLVLSRRPKARFP